MQQPPPSMWPIKILHYLLTSRKHDLQGTIERQELLILERVKELCNNNLQVGVSIMGNLYRQVRQTTKAVHCSVGTSLDRIIS